MKRDNGASIRASQRANIFLSALAAFAAALLVLSGPAVTAEVRARAVYTSKESVSLEKLDPVPLTCRRGPFRLEVPVTRLAAVEVLGGKKLRLRFPGGGTCVGKMPARPLSGEWSHGPFKQDWRRFRRLEILKPSASKPAEAGSYEALVKGSKGAALDGVRLRAGSRLEVRRGAFLFRVSWGRVRALKRDRSRDALEVLLADGRKFAGRPPKIFRGEWRGAVLTVPGNQLAEVILRGSRKPPAPSAKRTAPQEGVWGAVADDSGMRVRLIGPPRFDGPFNLWDPVKQARDWTLLPLSRGKVTYLVSAGRMTRLVQMKASASGKEKGLYRVTLASGKTYTGSVGNRKLLGRSPEGEFEVPLSRVGELTRAARPAGRDAPPGIRAVLRLTSGEEITLYDPLFFYERKLLPDWRETGMTWTGGHTKGFLFVRLGKTVQRVSFGKLSRIEVPGDLNQKFTFVNRDGSRLALRVEWGTHKAFEDLTGVDQFHKTAGAYALAHLGLLGWLEPGVRAHVPWGAIRAVDLEGARRAIASPASPAKNSAPSR